MKTDVNLLFKKAHLKFWASYKKCGSVHKKCLKLEIYTLHDYNLSWLVSPEAFSVNGTRMNKLVYLRHGQCEKYEILVNT